MEKQNNSAVIFLNYYYFLFKHAAHFLFTFWWHQGIYVQTKETPLAESAASSSYLVPSAKLQKHDCDSTK